MGYGVFRATHTGEGRPVPPTGQRVEADYVYVMQFLFRIGATSLENVTVTRGAGV